MRPKGLEPPAHCLEGSCSIHLSYGRTLLSQWVPLWRQLCVGTGCERNNTIPIAFCQGKSEKSFNFFALRAKMAVPACRNGLTAATFRHSPAQSQCKAAHHVPHMMHPGEHPQAADEQGNAHHHAARSGVEIQPHRRQHGGAQRVAGGMECPRLSFATSGVKPGCS